MRAKVFLLVACLVSVAGCQQPNAGMSRQQMRQLQIRQMQTHEYPIKDGKRAIKAVLNVLQDEAYIPRQVNLDVGFVHAVKEVDVEDSRERFWAKFWKKKQDARWNKNAVVECAANVTEVAGGMRLRINFQVKLMNNLGEVVSIEAIQDPQFYQQFFAKVDKGVYLEKEGV